MRKTILSAVSLMKVRSEKQSPSLASQRLLVQMALLVFFSKLIGKQSVSVSFFLSRVFFRNGFLLKEFNHTHLAIIPKIDNPLKVAQFRPISLTNFSYKIISKILANRFKSLLHKIISSNQFAFLQGRPIQDNSILAHELFHTMKQKRGRGGLMALK
jgi:hypothetical protein